MNPIALSWLMVAFVPAAPTASFLKKLSSLLKLLAITVSGELIKDQAACGCLPATLDFKSVMHAAIVYPS
ncbi:MAG TPA: hypothetical protein PLB25_01740 [Rhodoferax sp.]|nr:hypothetical protein [Rhodoferax sp.]